MTHYEKGFAKGISLFETMPKQYTDYPYTHRYNIDDIVHEAVDEYSNELMVRDPNKYWLHASDYSLGIREAMENRRMSKLTHQGALHVLELISGLFKGSHPGYTMTHGEFADIVDGVRKRMPE